MRRVFRVVSALSAGAALVWGLAKSLRRKGDDEGRNGATWPPEPDARRPEPKPVTNPPVKKPEPAPVEPEAVVEPEVSEPEAAEPEEELVLKGVAIASPAKLVAYVNGASEDDLKSAGLKGKALSILLEERPFADAETLGSTSGIGRRTLQTLCNALD